MVSVARWMSLFFMQFIAVQCKQLGRIHSDVTELNWTDIYGLMFVDLANGKAVMHYSRHCLTSLAAYVTNAYSHIASANDQWACPLASSSKIKPCQFSSVQLRRSVCAFRYAHTQSRPIHLHQVRKQPSSINSHQFLSFSYLSFLFSILMFVCTFSPQIQRKSLGSAVNSPLQPQTHFTGPVESTAGSGETFSRGPQTFSRGCSGEKIFDFFF